MVNMNNVNNEQWGEFSGLQETWSKTKACTAPGQRLKGADEISRENHSKRCRFDIYATPAYPIAMRSAHKNCFHFKLSSKWDLNGEDKMW